VNDNNEIEFRIEAQPKQEMVLLISSVILDCRVAMAPRKESS
jgi:hypothetical protein